MEQNYKKGKPQFLPVLPLKNLVALPKSILPVVVGRDVSIKAIEFALENGKQIFVTAQKSANVEIPTESDVYEYGTRALIVQVARMPNGTYKILIEGISRAKVVESKKSEGFMGVMAQDLTAIPLKENTENTALWRNLFDLFKEYVQLNEKISEEVLGAFRSLADLDYLTDTIAVQLPLDFKDKQEILEIIDLKKRAIRLSVILKNEIEVLQAEKNIRKRVQRQIEKNQKDYYLTEQMRAIQRELGREDYQQEINELRKKAKKLRLPKEAAQKVEAELKRLESMQPTSPEASVSRNYVDWVLSVPWHKMTKDDISMQDAEKILDASHAG